MTITATEDKYEINLDGRKLKTPKGNVFHTYNHWLALMVANEWQSQQTLVQLSSMHLTQLTNTAIDNPSNSSAESMASEILDFIDSDTLCFRIAEPKELADLQRREWDPLIDWFQQTFNCEIPVTATVQSNGCSETSKRTLRRHLCSHNRWSLIGLKFATENLKSLILSLALTKMRISVNQSIELSRLEENFEIDKWGRLESVHDLDSHSLRARVSAALLFYFSNCEVRQVSRKGDSLKESLKSQAI